MNYNKPYLNHSEQLNLLKSRGMIVNDETRALFYLEKIGYYRLTGYSYHFREYNSIEKLALDNYKEYSEFSALVDLYIFDKKLRLLILDAVERIEIAIRAIIVETLGKKSPQAHRDKYTFSNKFSTSFNAYDLWLKKQDQDFKSSREEFAKHFNKKYPNQFPPVWIAAETWDFGTMSRLFSGLKNAEKKEISKKFAIYDSGSLESWVRCLNYVRNICAHHARLWNKPLSTQGKFDSKSCPEKLYHLVNNTHAQVRIYSALSILRYLMLTICPSSKWKERLKKLIKTFPQSPYLSLKSMGFPDDWEKLPLWHGTKL